jgi:arylsulfatase A-like enzyme
MYTPHLDTFASEALVFDDVYAASFPTVPARADLATGRFTFPYLDWGPLPLTEVTLAECLSRSGRLTFGIADTPFVMRNGYGYDRGFQDFVYIRGQKTGPEHNDHLLVRRAEEDYLAPQTFRGAAAWLERHHREQPFFLYVDTWDPHEPWDPPAHYVQRYLPGYDGRVVDPVYWDYRADGVSDDDLALAHAAYCGEISMVDHWFGYLLERVRALGLAENTAIIFVSDHGFYFGEHGLFGKRRFRWPNQIPFIRGFDLGLTLAHGRTYRSPLHQEVTRLPLLMAVPGMKPRLAGVPGPPSVQSKSILPLVRGDVESLHDVAITSAPLPEAQGTVSKTVDDFARDVQEVSPSTITDGQWDLLYGVAGDPVELYQTQADPAHQHNLAVEYPAEAERLHAAFVHWLEAAGTAPELLAPRRSLGLIAA